MQWYAKATLGFYFSKTSLTLMLGGGRKWILGFVHTLRGGSDPSYTFS